MPSIAAATRARRSRERRRLMAGVGLLLAGALLVGLGAAGAVSGASAKTGAVVGGLAALGGLLALVARARLAERERAFVAVGVAVGLASLLFFWGLAPADLVANPSPVAVAAALGYLFGLTIVLAAVLAAVSVRPRADRAPDASATVAWRRSAPSQSSAADGGATDDELAFPLEDD